VEARPRAGKLPGTAAASVCGFNARPSNGIDVGLVSCDYLFSYQSSESPDDTERTFAGESRCHSPAYVCTASTSGYWKTGIVTYLGANGDAQTAYGKQHYVVAPTLSECGGDVDPGFETSTPAGADAPYLAHDLDVYTPPASTKTGPELSTGTGDYAGAVYGDAIGRTFDAFDRAFGATDPAFEAANDADHQDNVLAERWSCPAIAYGPGEAELDHSPDERIDVTEVAEAAQLLRGCLRRVSG